MTSYKFDDTRNYQLQGEVPVEVVERAVRIANAINDAGGPDVDVETVPGHTMTYSIEPFHVTYEGSPTGIVVAPSEHDNKVAIWYAIYKEPKGQSND